MDGLTILTLYQEPISEKTAHGKTGHVNIYNNSTTNIFFEKEQGYYHQGEASDDKSLFLCFLWNRRKRLSAMMICDVMRLRGVS